jgi:hypothetical protein
MDEVKFVLKAFVATIAIVFVMQIQVGNESLETKADFWIHTSSVPKYLQGVADGAVKALKTASKSASEMIGSATGSVRGPAPASSESKASKWNIEFKHSKAKSSQPTDSDGDQE